MQTILFDLDGTLIDHFTTIHRSVAYAQKQLGLPISDYATVRRTVGGSFVATLSKLLGEEHLDAAVPLFKDYFEQIMTEDVEILPGVEWILSQLHANGHTLAVFTNKLGDHSRTTLEHLDLAHWFKAIVGTNDTPYRKPDPRFTAHMLEILDVASDETILIGDSPFDFEAAEAGCLKSYLLTTGTHDKKELTEHTNANGIYENFFELGEAVFGLEPFKPKPVVE